jgi:hydroxymethylbilane synthase
MIENEMLHLRALIADTDGTEIIRGEEYAPRQNAEQLGVRVARALLEQGGGELLRKLSAG